MKLSRPIVLRDGAELITLADACAFILAEPEHIQTRAVPQFEIRLLRPVLH
jgi:hypothetical protein